MTSRSTREGSVGLLILLGIFTIGAAIYWLKDVRFGQTTYQINVDFPQANGVGRGTPVLFRGVQVGRVVSVTPKTNGIEAKLEITPGELRMPPELLIEPSRQGLIGEAVVEITPSVLISDDIGTMTPISPDCDSQVIVCDGDRLTGRASGQVLNSLAQLAELYGDPEFFENFTNALASLSVASEEIVTLSRDLSAFTEVLETEVKQLGVNANQITASINGTADNINNLTKEVALVTNNLNDLIVNNSDNITTTIASINQSSDELGLLVAELRPTIAQLNSTLTDSDITQLLNNLEVLSANLRDFSDQLSSETNILTIQQLLDSARATFANAEKITADLDQLTGDPQFRDNVRRLVNGLSQLVSSTEQLEQRVQTAQVLNTVASQLETKELSKPILTKPVKNY
ncbi:MlaD family protein [Gloeocapsa sp. PCC 73106]|uniref:MlaD family protein n=1 Tax=Gloeocapsa sp. PCC 73106 TaxID=102232 RepID=UPI0002AC02E3|nr:MlaD family protein [Gloeocapsa sp. PCC 73106]ELR97499.1 ABC-type transport system involved in resistance to organic solvents, periplasmic component [Gloeocapsa sp. PCC 73106]